MSPGNLIIVASLQLLLLVNIAEFLYPGYSVSSNYISDLGVGPSPSKEIFTLGVLAFGLLILLAAALLYERKGSYLWLFFAISGVGALGVAVFNEDTGAPHALFAVMAFAFGCLAAVYAFRITKPMFSYISLALGLIGLAAFVLLGMGVYLGLGPGGMERMIFYPGVLWALAYGVRIQALEDKRRTGPT
ncbi:MAG: DUF998 domain-containing protein [Methanomassiliicoccales archaeon]|nr:DUF998 domain-containing protein [Methanomassiliicoccales archaeon]